MGASSRARRYALRRFRLHAVAREVPLRASSRSDKRGPTNHLTQTGLSERIGLVRPPHGQRLARLCLGPRSDASNMKNHIKILPGALSLGVPLWRFKILDSAKSHHRARDRFALKAHARRSSIQNVAWPKRSEASASASSTLRLFCGVSGSHTFGVMTVP